LWPDDGPYEQNIVAKKRIFKNEVLDMIVELIRMTIILD
jgi:hypothetical protein